MYGTGALSQWRRLDAVNGMASGRKADYIFHNAVVVTMAHRTGCGIIPDGAVAVKKDRIVNVGTAQEVMKGFSAHRYIDGHGKLVMPGLVDAHMHSGVSIFKGFAQDTENWMSDCVFPLKGALDINARRAGSMVMIAEAIKAGTTTMADSNEEMYYFADNHVRAGVRAHLSHTVHGLPLDRAVIAEGGLYPLDERTEYQSLEDCRKLIYKYHLSNNGRITCGLCPLGPDRVSVDTLRVMGEMSDRHQFPVHLHLACGKREVKQMQMRYGKRSIPFLHELGLVNKRLIAVHLSVATEEEIRFLAKKGAAMVLCSGSEGIVDGNVPPAAEFNRYSKRLAIGSDQTSGGNSCNLFYEMKVGAILNKCRFRNPAVFQAWKMLRLATIDGACAIGMGGVVGSLEAGKKADIIMLDLQVPQMTPVVLEPVCNIIPNLVYAANGSEVVLSMIDGKIVMEDRKLLTVDENEVIKDAAYEGQKLLEKAGHTLLDKNRTMRRLKEENKI